MPPPDPRTVLHSLPPLQSPPPRRSFQPFRPFRSAPFAWFLSDPRHYQILVLGSLLLYGVCALDLEARAANALVIALAAFATQLIGTRWTGQLRFDPRSVAISVLSLCLLLRTDSLVLAAAAAVLAIGSKFILRVQGKHVFNPTNFGIVAVMLASRGRAWVSPGQWGSAALFGFLLVCLGGLVVRRAARADVTLGFLGAYGSLLLGRALWLGQPLAIPLHQVESGAFLIFAFFMISDPKTTPDSRAGRILFAALVAAGAGWVQFALFRPTGLLLALAFLSPLVPLIDRLLPGDTYRWPRPARSRAAGAAGDADRFLPSPELRLDERTFA